MLDAGCGVPVDLLDDLAHVTVKCVARLCTVNRPADPALHTKRHRKVFFVDKLVQCRDSGTGRFRRQPKAVPAVSEFRRAFERSPAVAAHDDWDWDFWPRGHQDTGVADVPTAKGRPVAFEQLAHGRDVLIR